MSEISILADAAQVAVTAATRIANAAALAIRERGRFRLALSGGRTPQRLYRALAASRVATAGAGASPRADAGLRDVARVGAPVIDWSRVMIYFVDERAVPPGDPESNFRMAREALIDAARVPPRNVHRMKGEYPDLEVAAIEYEAHLLGPLDLLVLGIGEDGHTASLFPQSAALEETDRRVAVVEDAPKPPPRRLTLTPRAIAEARQVLMLATGAAKAAAVARALEGDAPIVQVPARLVRDRVWLLDRDAAGELASRDSRGARS